MPTFFIQSLGCPKNLVDSEQVSAVLLEKGFELCLSEDDADLLLLNTCSFIEAAREESFDEIKRLLRYRREGKKVFVLGCLPQMWREKLSARFPEIDGIMGVHDLGRGILSLIDDGTAPLLDGPPENALPEPRAILTAGHSVYLRVADGCNHSCSFCTIPSIRGRYRSRTMEEILDEMESLAAGGAREVTLLAQDLTFYGRDRGNAALPELLRELDAFGVWVRMLYLHPSSVTDTLLETVADSQNVLPYFDLPLQHVNREILRSMKRVPLDAAKLLGRIRSLGEAALRGTFIVGFPGEEDTHFEELLDFVETAGLDRMAAFPYSREDLTAAAKLDRQVSPEIRDARLEHLYEAQAAVVDRYNETAPGRLFDVLFDTPAAGRSFRDAPDIDGTILLREEEVEVGSVHTVCIEEGSGYTLTGRLAEPSPSPQGAIQGAQHRPEGGHADAGVDADSEE